MRKASRRRRSRWRTFGTRAPAGVWSGVRGHRPQRPRQARPAARARPSERWPAEGLRGVSALLREPRGFEGVRHVHVALGPHQLAVTDDPDGRPRHLVVNFEPFQAEQHPQRHDNCLAVRGLDEVVHLTRTFSSDMSRSKVSARHGRTPSWPRYTSEAGKSVGFLISIRSSQRSNGGKPSSLKRAHQPRTSSTFPATSPPSIPLTSAQWLSGSLLLIRLCRASVRPAGCR